MIDPTPSHLLLGSQWELLDLLRQTGIVARLVLLVLAAFSVWSWAIMWERRRTFRSVEAETEDFLKLFRAERNLTLVRDRIPEKMRTPLCALFRAGYHELARAAPSRGPDPAREAVGLRNIDRGLTRAAQEETVGLERGLGFLATTASATPFIGLFGTVWGIMNAFHGIGLTGSASLAAVAPGIAEALINTAAGLAAAIPAVVGYNHFLGRIRRMGVQMENFASEFAGEADRILHSRKESPQVGAEGGFDEAGMGSGVGRRGNLAEINVTPLVDVMLVLLIIFMVTAPMMTRGIDIDLPKVQSGADATETRITVAIDADRRVYLNQSLVNVQLLQDCIAPLVAGGDVFVFLRADAAVPYGFVMEIVDQVKRAGVAKVGLVTRPAPETSGP